MKTLLASTAALALMSGSAFAEIATRSFSFQHEGATLQGTLYLPSGHRAGDRLPAVIVTGAWTSVKEQMPAAYARAMAERGFAAVTFDFRGWGASGDLPSGRRFEENPAAKTADIRAAAAHVATLPEVDAGRIKGLGICASAGYMVDAASGNPLFRSVALVAPWLQNQAIVDQVYGGAAGVAGLRSVAATAAARGGEIIPAAGPVGAQGVLMPLGGYYYEPARGAIPQYDNKWNQTSWEPWLTYLPADSAPRLDKPLAIVHSEAAAIPQGVRAFLAGYRSQADVTWLPNVSQFDFYDQSEPVRLAADRVAAHFQRPATN